MNRENGQGIFFGVIGVATLIVAMIGATLAYFSAIAKGTEDAVSAQSGTVSISYTDSQVVSAGALIPASEQVVMTTYGRTGENQCIDDNDKEVCSVYHFEVINSGTSADIIGRMVVTENEFLNLKYMVYDVTTEGSETKILDSTALTATAGENVSIFGMTGENYTSLNIQTSATKKYDVVIYLANIDENQDEQGKKFTATAEVEILGAVDGKIQGYVNP